MKIGPWDVSRDVLMIAEIGNNHEGNVHLAEELIGVAAKAGAGAVKFKTIVPEKLVSLAQKDRIEQLKKFQLQEEDFRRLKKVADRENVLFLSTPFDLESARFLNDLVPAFKIASGDNNFFPLLAEVCKTGKPVILSSGLSDLNQIRHARDFIFEQWQAAGIKAELAILHCVTNYPTPIEQANLLAIRELQSLGVTVGYSDHTMGIEAAVLSVALGARIIEKHFTLSKTHSSFRDHQLSADPKDLAELVRRVKEASQLLGDGVKKIESGEAELLDKVRRSIRASRALTQGSQLSWNDLGWARPFQGLAPGQENLLIGRKLKRNIEAGEAIQLADIE